MNHTSSASGILAPTKPTHAPKRRGRPRSPVFGYYRRIVSESGEFQGNKCRFCSFTSRDRSENPTYLTRHILRSCEAPQEVKDAMCARQSGNLGSASRVNHNVPQNARPLLPVETQDPTASASNRRPMSGSTAGQGPRASAEATVLAQVDVESAPKDLANDFPLAAASSVIAATGAALDPQQPQISKETPHTNPLSAGGLRHAGQSHGDPCAVNSTGTRTIVQSHGVTKSRRGRPRSQALRHFRRHVDEKGNFIANQCSHCTFVSRDRSENSTLLLRHLLSQTCGAPENVRVVLRGNRYTVDGKRTNKIESAASDSGRRTGSKFAGTRTPGGTVESHGTRTIPASKISAQNFDAVSSSIIRFFVRHGIDFRATESKLFRDLLESVGFSQGLSGPYEDEISVSKKLQSCTNKSQMTRTDWASVQAFWESTPISQIIPRDPCDTGAVSSSHHLIIYFPDYSNRKYCREAAPECTAGKNWNPTEASMIASTFLWTSGSRLEYTGSRNCSNDIHSCIAELVSQSQRESESRKTGLDQIFIGRPIDNLEHSNGMTKIDPVNTWIWDVPREIDILAQELLSQVPILARCIRRNKLLASFFRETYSSRTAVMLFGRNLAEKEQCARYKAHIALPLQLVRCRDAVENAEQTYKVLSHAQSSHKNRQRLQETSTFLHTINEENAGNVQLCKDMTRLVLSEQYLKELEIFIAVMRPLASLIDKYSCGEDLSFVNQESSLQNDFFLCGRSLAKLLPDCVHTLRDIYTEKYREWDSDLRLLRTISTRRLLGQGGRQSADVCTPLVDDICYLAAFLDPTSNFSTMAGIKVEDAWRRAISYLRLQYASHSDISLDRAIDQLQKFHQRSGIFSASEIFDIDGTEHDPRFWWQKHGRLAPDLFVIAFKVLNAPTAAFSIVRYVAEMNGRQPDLNSLEKDNMMEKRRLLHWNLRLSEFVSRPSWADSMRVLSNSREQVADNSISHGISD